MRKWIFALVATACCGCLGIPEQDARSAPFAAMAEGEEVPPTRIEFESAEIRISFEDFRKAIKK